ncbi:magnesium transporter CorA family protein [Saccharibacillus sp. CPCC 101409]|uniref:magnesium transporter CorA family protein n=1 Tax=Saccharibacillus sp. CPCC 101409 TaxID=3058041 RepID=UPI002670F64C|nr:magnesium transporter CorA family protein [Saccharibacillus sp. CPCC 101409]MDO3408870.1 magnesium transporter CorA family protein [Saccharibacillus sp. CPCC 101409]
MTKQPMIHARQDREGEETEDRRWAWYDFANYAEAKEQPDFDGDGDIAKWLGDITARTRNRTLAIARHNAESVLNGTLALDMAPDKRDNTLLLHYFVSRDKLILIGGTDIVLTRTDRGGLQGAMLDCRSPIDALLVLLSEILEFFFVQSDSFEQNLHALEEEMRTRNDRFVLKKTIDLRNDLTYWNAQIIPIKEMHFSAEETFREDVEDSECMHILELRLKRIDMLQKEYDDEIDSLLRVDENITNYRSNDIMKALTVYTVLLTPTTALGAIWGMNFKYMPELDWPLGYVFSLALILATTGATYWWLKRRGLTSDILNMNMRSGGRPEPNKQQGRDKAESTGAAQDNFKG